MVPVLITVKSSLYISTETPSNNTRPTIQTPFVIYLQLSTFAGNLHRDRAIIQPAISSTVDGNIAWMRVVPLPNKCLVQISRKYRFAFQPLTGYFRRHTLSEVGKFIWNAVWAQTGWGETSWNQNWKSLSGDTCVTHEWGAGISLLSEVPGRWSALNCTASLFSSLLAYRSTKKH